MRGYLAGPMTGLPQFNFPAFDAAAKMLRDAGHEVISPAELDDPETRKKALASPDGAPGSGSHDGETWGDFLARDIKLIADGTLDVIWVLPGWESSKGALLETFVHAGLMGKPVIDLFLKQQVPATVLTDAWDDRMMAHVRAGGYYADAVPLMQELA